MEYILKDVDYKNIFKYFEEISNTPRGSNYNEQIGEYLMNVATEKKLQCQKDQWGNVLIIKEATKGYEHRPTVIIQGHMDMVCQKNVDVEHDFENEGLDIYIDEENNIRARGTTLGADNGVAVAYALALLDDKEAVHPRIEIVITTDEEIGMDGAKNFDASSLKGKYLINIDSEDEDVLLSSCAGGMTARCELSISRQLTTGAQIDINICGLQGGHSGMEIVNNRVNASILMGRLLFELDEHIDYKLIEIVGGTKDNVITNKSFAKIMVDLDKQKQTLEIIQKIYYSYKVEYKKNEPKLDIVAKCVNYNITCETLEDKSKKDFLFILVNSPQGVQVMSSNIEGLVESSLNMGILQVQNDKVVFGYAVRSSLNSYKHFMSKKLESLYSSVGATCVVDGEYEPWEYNENSKLRQIFVDIYKKMFEKPQKIQAIHAGLECGIFASKIENLDIVSFGPNMSDIHTTNESLNIPSAIRVYDYLLAVLKEICDKDE